MMSLRLAAVLLLAATAVGTAIGLYGEGKKSGTAMAEAKQAKSATAARSTQRAATQATLNRGTQAGAQHERNRAALDALFTQLATEQSHAPADPVDACVLPADRLRIWRDANAGATAEAAATPQFDDGASGAAATSVGAGARSGGQPPGRDAGLPPAGLADVPAAELPAGQPQ